MFYLEHFSLNCIIYIKMLNLKVNDPLTDCPVIKTSFLLYVKKTICIENIHFLRGAGENASSPTISQIVQNL